MDRFENANYLNPDKKALLHKPPKFNIKCQYEELYSTKTHFSDLDMNGHIIASKYFTWLDDAINKLHEQKKIDFLQMNYYNEVIWMKRFQFNIVLQKKQVLRY